MAPIIFPHMWTQLSHELESRGHLKDVELSMTELKEALILLMKNMPPDLAIFFLIDGVDEFSGDHFELCKYLVRLTETTSIKLLVSSRPIPECHQIFCRFPSKLRLQDLTADDIQAYIDEELMQDGLFLDMDRLENGFAREVKNALTEKASGVFLWIVLVVKRLLIGLANYDSKDILIRVIDELPSDLEKLYDHMFGRMSKEHQQEGALLLQFVRHAKDKQRCHLAASQLYVALQSSLDGCTGDYISMKSVRYGRKHEALRVKVIEGKLRSRCCGLLEVEYHALHGPHRVASVEFLHRTVYDYICDSTIWSKITSLHKLNTRTLNIPLLASIVHRMKREELSSNTTSEQTEGLKYLFEACLEYATEIESLADSSYITYLSAAEDILLLKLSQLRNHCIYTYVSLRLSVASQWGLPYTVHTNQHFMNRFMLETESSFAILTCMIGLLGFSEYFKLKVSSWKNQSVHKGSALLYLISLAKARHSDPKTMWNCVCNIASLLRVGMNPNTEISMELFNNLPSISNEAASLRRLNHWRTPWNCWVFCAVNNLAHAKITLHMLEAGADLDCSAEPMKAALLNLYQRLRTYRDTCKDAETHATLEKILARMASVAPKRRRRSDIDDTIEPVKRRI